MKPDPNEDSLSLFERFIRDHSEQVEVFEENKRNTEVRIISQLTVLSEHVLKLASSSSNRNHNIWMTSTNNALTELSEIIDKHGNSISIIEMQVDDGYNGGVQAYIAALDRYKDLHPSLLKKKALSRKCPWDIKSIIKATESLDNLGQLIYEVSTYRGDLYNSFYLQSFPDICKYLDDKGKLPHNKIDKMCAKCPQSTMCITKFNITYRGDKY